MIHLGLEVVLLVVVALGLVRIPVATVALELGQLRLELLRQLGPAGLDVEEVPENLPEELNTSVDCGVDMLGMAPLQVGEQEHLEVESRDIEGHLQRTMEGRDIEDIDAGVGVDLAEAREVVLIHPTDHVGDLLVELPGPSPVAGELSRDRPRVPVQVGGDTLVGQRALELGRDRAILGHGHVAGVDPLGGVGVGRYDGRGLGAEDRNGKKRSRSMSNAQCIG